MLRKAEYVVRIPLLSFIISVLLDQLTVVNQIIIAYLCYDRGQVMTTNSVTKYRWNLKFELGGSTMQILDETR